MPRVQTSSSLRPPGSPTWKDFLLFLENISQLCASPHPSRLLESFLLPEFPNRIRHIFQEEIDKIALIVFKLTEHSLSLICSFLNIEMKTLLY